MLKSISRYSIKSINKAELNTDKNVSVSSSSSLNDTNLKIRKLIDSQQYREALELFNLQPIKHNNIIYNLALKACSKLKDYQSGIRIHQELSSNALQDPFIQTSLIHFYMQCHDVDQAEAIFATVKNKTAYAYGAMFKGYISNNRPEKVIELFQTMSIEPNDILIIILFNACAKVCSSQAKKLGKYVLSRLPTSFFTNPNIVNTIIDMLMKFGDVNEAEDFFEKIEKKDIVTHRAMMQGYVTNSLFDKALDLFEKIPLTPNEFLHSIAFKACALLSNERANQLGKKIFSKMPEAYRENIVSITSAIYMFMKFGEVQTAEYLFSEIKSRNTQAYGVMINGYKINEQPEKCLSLFEQMKQKKFAIHEATLLSMIGACAQIGMRRICEDFVRQISIPKFSINVNTALIDMWGKSGDINRAKQVFVSISRHDITAYTSMINAYGRNGMGHEAIDLYNKIPENIRDQISHVCVLNACSHSGLVDQAQIIFNKIEKKSTEVITTMVDCLSRMAMFDEAEKLIDDFEQSNSPYFVMHCAMLSGARNHGHVALAEKVYNRMLLVFPNEKSCLISASILLSNTYSSIGNNEKAELVRINRLKQFGNKVEVGVSWTEVNGQVVRFKAHDRSHPQSDKIYAEIERLSNELKEHGHQSDSSWVTRPLKPGETVDSVLCTHSERLAMAFNFIQTPRPSVIQITKNLRICGDCHRATKLIAKIRQCEIIVRDANRVHHFHTNGQCSCQDHF